jgi:hypothetical protein
VATQVGGRLYHQLAAAAGARLNDGERFWSDVGLGAALPGSRAVALRDGKLG